MAGGDHRAQPALRGLVPGFARPRRMAPPGVAACGRAVCAADRIALSAARLSRSDAESGRGSAYGASRCHGRRLSRQSRLVCLAPAVDLVRRGRAWTGGGRNTGQLVTPAYCGRDPARHACLPGRHRRAGAAMGALGRAAIALCGARGGGRHLLAHRSRARAPAPSLPFVEAAAALLLALPMLQAARVGATERAIDTRQVATAWVSAHIRPTAAS